MITPFDSNNKLNKATVGELVEHLIQNGSDALVVAGTTGESPALSFEEKLELFRLVRESAGNRVKVIAGTGSNNTSETIRLTKAAETIGMDGAMLVGPYYNKPPQHALYEHFRAVANSTELPIMIYNVPGRTSRNIEASTVAKLAEIDNIVAVKEASGNLEQVTQIVRLTAGKTTVYSGDDSLTLPMLSVGAQGVVSVASHLVGNQIKRMISSYLSGDIATAQQLHCHLFPMFKGLFFTTNPIPVKTAMKLLGFDVGSLRLPLTDATPDEEKTISELLRMYNIL